MASKRISPFEILIWILVVFLLLAVLSPIGMGFKIQNDYPAMIQQHASSMDMVATVKSFKRGLYSSQAQIEITDPGSGNALMMIEDIIHGPIYLGLLTQGKSPLVAAVVKGKLAMVGNLQQAIKDLSGFDSLLGYQSVIDFNGNLEADLYSPPINNVTTKDGEQVRLNTSGIVGHTSFNVTEQKVVFTMSFPALNYESATEAAMFKHIQLDFAVQRGKTGILIGDSAVAFKDIDLDLDGKQFAMKDFGLRTITSENGQLIGSVTQVRMRSMLADNAKIGPAQLNIDVQGLDANALLQFQKTQKDINAKRQQGMPEDQINSMMAGKMMTLVPALFKQAKIVIDPLTIDSELGKVDGTLSFSVSGLDDKAPMDPTLILAAINFDLNLAIDKALLKKLIEIRLENEQAQQALANMDKAQKSERKIPVPQKVDENIQGMIDENWLQSSADGYTLDMSLHEGKMQLNGKPFNPMQMMMSGMGQAPKQ